MKNFNTEKKRRRPAESHAPFLPHGLLKMWISAAFCALLFACGTARNGTAGRAKKASYGYDADFLKQHTQHVLELTQNNGASRVLLSADYQGRVLTSTAGGANGLSFGWLNYDLIAAQAFKKQFNPVGGEERFWLGPEGGQFSLYFKQPDSFRFANWQVPPLVDTEAFAVAWQSDTAVQFTKSASIANYSGAVFGIEITRTIRLLSNKSISEKLGMAISPKLKVVGYESLNTLRNAGDSDWLLQNGVLSIWLLGMFKPTPQTVVLIPFSPGAGARQFITDDYFGAVPAERLQVTDSVLYFTADGRYRSKIGLSPLIAKQLAAAYDFQNNVLTVLLPQVHPRAAYVNSKWEWQSEPYKGDVINAYNDGPLEDGSQMGPFFEIESSSPALQLKAGEEATYTQATVHLQGSYGEMKKLVQGLLSVDLDRVKK